MITPPARADLDQILDSGETVVWSGRPHAGPFFASGVPFLLFGLGWGAFDYFLFIRQMNFKSSVDFGLVGFFALHLLPLWMALANIVRLPVVYRNTVYALTNRRVIIRAGFFGVSFQSIDYDCIQESSVSVGPLERLLGLGTVCIFSGNRSSKGYPVYDKFIGIDNPYDVYKQLKEVSVNIKTDWNYPNALRPPTNPGYGTTYLKP